MPGSGEQGAQSVDSQFKIGVQGEIDASALLVPPLGSATTRHCYGFVATRRLFRAHSQTRRVLVALP